LTAERRNRASARQYRPDVQPSSSGLVERGPCAKNVLVIDVGGTSVKILATAKQKADRSDRDPG
jgi:hypothetical protein